MFSEKVVKEVVARTLAQDAGKRRRSRNPAANEDRVIPMLINDIFGGEILKTHKRNDWLFNNRIKGERIDLSGERKRRSDAGIRFDTYVWIREFIICNN